MKKLPTHSPEWWQGYHYQGPARRNPYIGDAVKAQDWLDGWTCRFYGEQP